MVRVCGNCRTTQGPFARFEFEPHQFIFTCPQNRAGKTPEERQLPVRECIARRAKLDKEGLL